MKSDKRQTLAMVGIALIVLAGVIIYISISQPKVYSDTSTVTSSATAYQTTQSTQTQDTQVYTSTDTTTSVSYPVNLNTATLEQLESINGIGEKRASLIIAYRSQIGAYTDVSQIKNIQGIGDDIYNQVAPYLTV